MPERKNHQDSKEYGGLPLRFKMPLPTFSISSDPPVAVDEIQGQVPTITKNIRSQVFS
jgi:hypothetical protein